jgi:hypothetical protein
MVEIREPTAGELRGIKLLDLLQLDTGAAGPVLERVSDLTALELYALSARDAMAVMSELVSFFTPTEVETQPASPQPSRTPGK